MFIRVQVVRESRRPRSRKRHATLIGLGLLTGLAVAVPLALGAVRITGFADVPPSNPNHDAIDRVTNAGIMTPCQTSPQLLFCPTTALGRQWAAANYDRMLGLAGTPGNFVPTFRGVNVVTGGGPPPFTVDSSTKVTNLNADLLDGIDSTGFYPTGSTVADSAKLGGLDPSAYLPKISRFAGQIASIASSGAYVFAGPTVTITTAAGDLLTGSAEAPLGLSPAPTSPYFFFYGLCFQPSGGGSITNFVGDLFSIGSIAEASRHSWAASASTVPGAGSWKVGFCVYNSGASAINNNDFVNGWVMKTSSATQGTSAVSATAGRRP